MMKKFDEVVISNIEKQTARPIDLIVIHCSATREGQPFDARDYDRMHKKLGWSGIGYHYVILLDGTIEKGRPDENIGSHVRGHNSNSIGVVYTGGLDRQGKAKDTRTDEQRAAMTMLVQKLHELYPDARIVGHRDLSPDKDGDGVVEPHEWLKMCPCFPVGPWWAGEY